VVTIQSKYGWIDYLLLNTFSIDTPKQFLGTQNKLKFKISEAFNSFSRMTASVLIVTLAYSPLLNIVGKASKTI
jgi:hypothetical protein